MNVTAQDLLEGMWYSYESCGEGLQAAADLFEHGYYSRSAALAMAARDELGKARLFRDLWRRADAGGTVTIEEVRTICGEFVKGLPKVTHVKKQEAAQVSVTLRGEHGDPLWIAVQRQDRAVQEVTILCQQGVPDDDPRLVAAHAEWDAARVEMKRLADAAKLRVPGERRELRERGLYVDVGVEAGKVSWKRPNEITYDEARDALLDALNDYRGVRRNLEPPFVALPEAGSPAFAAALAAWANKPTLPEAPYVQYRTAAQAAASKTAAPAARGGGEACDGRHGEKDRGVE